MRAADGRERKGWRVERAGGRVGRSAETGTLSAESVAPVIKASLRRKCRTIYRKVKGNYDNILMNGDAHALLIASTMYMHSSSDFDYSLPFMTSS